MKRAIRQSTLTTILNVSTIILVIVVAILFSFVMSNTNMLNKANSDRYLLVSNAHRFMDASALLTNEVRAFAATGDEDHYYNYWKEVRTDMNRETAVTNMLEIGLTEEENSLVNEMHNLSDTLVPIEREAMELAKDGNFSEAISIVYGKEYIDWVANIRGTQKALINKLEERTTNVVNHQMENLSRLLYFAIMCVVLTIFMQIISSVIIRKKVVNPIAEIRDEMELISKGILASDFSLEPNTSEIGRLTAAIIKTKQSLKLYIGDISEKLAILAHGDFTTRVEKEYIGEFVEIKEAMNTIAEILKEQQERDLISREELVVAYEKANAANIAKSKFLSNMSHDIRTPMNAIIGMTSIAQKNLDDVTKVEDCLKRISLSSSHLVGLINDVLDMSAIESGKLTLNNDNIYLPEVIENVVNIVQPLAKAKKQSFDINILNVEHEKLYSDALRLNQVFINILSNAVKFTPVEGTISMLIKEMPSRKSDTAHFQFVFSDTGIGMSEEFIKDIFSAFSREGSRVKKIQGTGLGMAICKKIIDIMEGSIDVESEENKGSKFTIDLDIPITLVSNEEMILSDIKILVVDDDSRVGESSVKLLNEMNARADWTDSGKKALEMINTAKSENEPYQVVILDWKMPDMDGLTVATEIRSTSADETKIIFTSAYDWSEIEKEAIELGAVGFISKPLFKSSIYQAFNRYVYEVQKQEETVDADIYDFTGKTALLVDDIEINRVIATEMLVSVGMNVETAENGIEALTLFSESKENHFSIVLMDIQMPIMDGYEASRKIRELIRNDAKTTPIVAMSANSFTEDVKEALDSGMNSHIPKPIDVLRLYRELQHHFEI